MAGGSLSSLRARHRIATEISMAEHKRANGYQWVDDEVCMVWDHYINEPIRFYKGGHIGPLDAALDFVTTYPHHTLPCRTAIIRVPAVVARKLTE